jgi:L-2,4-diaminobutyrate decarboxylase
MTFKSAFDAERFRAEGHALVDQLATYLGRAVRGEVPVLCPSSPETVAARYPADFPTEGNGDGLGALVDRVLADAVHQHNPGYVGHQVTAPLPVAVLADLAAALLNNGMAAFEAGPPSTAMEQSVCRWLAAQLGWAPGADGFLTSGGSLGNLTALLVARQAAAGFDAWTEGDRGGPPLAVISSDQAHYSVTRAVQIMGWGAGGVITVPVDDQYRMRADLLGEALARARAAGRRVVAVIGHAASTATGAIDPLDQIAAFCAAEKLWFHVDGAHGASLALSPQYRHLLAGIERADSVVWDAHKLMVMPSLVTAVLFRRGETSFQAFAQQASYLYTTPSPYDMGLRTLECTKRMMSLKLYASLSLLGTRVFGEHVTRVVDLAKRFAVMLRETPGFTVATEPQCNIVCFRYAPPGHAVADLDALQERIRDQVIAAGGHFLVKTRLPSGVHLRTALMNPLTGEPELRALIQAIQTSA